MSSDPQRCCFFLYLGTYPEPHKMNADLRAVDPDWAKMLNFDSDPDQNESRVISNPDQDPAFLPIPDPQTD